MSQAKRSDTEGSMDSLGIPGHQCLDSLSCTKQLTLFVGPIWFGILFHVVNEVIMGATIYYYSL